MGEPGSGKTVLAEAMVFANADNDRPILYLTTLSEPLEKIVRYLQGFQFFDESKLSGAVIYDSIGAEVAEQGVAAVVPRLKEAINTHRPKIIVIDSFKAIHDVSTSIAEMRRMLFEMAGLLTAFETTAFLIGEYASDQVATYPEFAVADSMIDLTRRKTGTRDERFIRVLKLRGSHYLEGLHGFEITPAGLTVYPRLVSPGTPPSYSMMRERITTGVRGLDEMLRGGLPRGRSTFVVGPTGSGKTTLALQFALEGVRLEEETLYVSFEENPTQLDAQIAALGADPAQARQGGFLEFIYVSPVELRIDSIITRMFQIIQTARDTPDRDRRRRRSDHGGRRSAAHAQLSVRAHATFRGQGRDEHSHVRGERDAHRTRREDECDFGQHHSSGDRRRRAAAAVAACREGARRWTRSGDARVFHRCLRRTSWAAIVTAAFAHSELRAVQLRKLTEVSRALTYDGVAGRRAAR